MADAELLKNEGNRDFKAGNYLKAAASYTKAIKAEPANAVLYSNRSAALLKLNKVQKALSDAEECISLRPDWDKGYFRKGTVLQAMDRNTEALDAYKQAAQLNAGNREVADKVTVLTKLQHMRSKEGFAFGKAAANGAASGLQPAAQQPAAADPQPVQPAGVCSDTEYDLAKENRGTQQPVELQQQRIARFTKAMRAGAATTLREQKLSCEPTVWFLPGQAADGEEEQLGQVSIKQAFTSQDTLVSCIGFLRQYAADQRAHAACAIVPKHRISYPQVWAGKAWQHRNADGVFLELHTHQQRRAWFLPYSAKKGELGELEKLPAEFFLLEPLLP